MPPSVPHAPQMLSSSLSVMYLSCVALIAWTDKECPGCAAPVQRDSRYCFNCGRSLDIADWFTDSGEAPEEE